MIYIDLETYSETPISAGTYVYAENAEIMLLSFAVDEAPVRVVDFTDDPDARVEDMMELQEALLEQGQAQLAHNAMFDRTVLRMKMPHLCLPIPQWRCNMVRAMAHGLPAGLEELGEVMGLGDDMAKLKEGKDLVQLFCKPRPKNMTLRRATRHTHPAQWATFKDYAGRDIVAMRALWKKLPSWNYRGKELAMWHLDQQINDRGIYIDMGFVTAAQREAKRTQEDLKEATKEATNGELESTTQRDKTLAYLLAEHGVDLPNLKSDTLQRRMEDPELPDALRTLLAIRLEASKTSSTKYNKIARAVNLDGRLRGTLQFDGASRTRRWAGRTVQPQNMMRPPFYLEEQDDWEAAIAAIEAGATDLLYDKPAEVCSALVRAALAAKPGHKFSVADLANIEGRGTAWLAGELWKLQAFRDYDAGTGPDLYKLAYSRAFNINVAEVAKSDRQIGKVMEVMLGYEGGVGAFITGAETYRIDLDVMAHAVLEVADGDVVLESREFLEWNRKKKRTTFGLVDDTFVACDVVKRLWRAAHPSTERLWHGVEDIARAAINSDAGRTYTFGKLRAERRKSWLLIWLPSGNAMCYPSARTDDKGQITYMGKDQYSRRWKRLKTYGGKLVENAVQSLSRDVLAHSMPRIEEAGYPICLTVHDEVITEVPDDDRFSHKELARIMSQGEDWTTGLPLAAAGFDTHNYRKG